MSNSVKKMPVFSGENRARSHSKFACEYIQEFRNLDKYNKKYITDVEALNYFRTQHSLSKDDFELIIDVSNTDNNNNTLNEEEFAIAMHLIDIMNNKAMKDSDASLSLALRDEEQKSLRGSSNHDLKTHLGHHNIGRRCKELLDILYKEQSVWNSNREVYTDPNILGDSLERLRDNEEELIDIYNVLRRQVEECENSTETTIQQISKELNEMNSKPNTQTNNKSDANEPFINENSSSTPNPYKILFDAKNGDMKSPKTEDGSLHNLSTDEDNIATSIDNQVHENSALPYLSIVKSVFVKEGKENGSENNFAPQPQRNIRDRQMNSEHRIGDTPNVIDKMKSTLNQALPFTSNLVSGPATSTDNNDRKVRSNDESITTKGIVIPSVIGEFPGEFGKLQPLSQESITDKRSGDDPKNTGFFSGYFSGAINQLKSAVGAHQSNDLSVPNTGSPIRVLSVIGEFPGNFGKDTLESAALNNERTNKANILDNTAHTKKTLKDADTTNIEEGLTGDISVDPEILSVKSVIGQFPGDFGKEVLREAESTNRSGGHDLKPPINSKYIGTLSKKPLEKDLSKEGMTIFAQLGQDSYKVKSVIGEFPGDFGKLDVLHDRTPVHNPTENQVESNGLTGYLSGAFGQLKSIVVEKDDEPKTTGKSTSTSSSIIENPIIVSSAIGEFPGDFGKDILESASRDTYDTSQITDQGSDRVHTNKIPDEKQSNPTGIDQNDWSVKSVAGDFPGSFGKNVIESITSQNMNTRSKEMTSSIESTKLDESQNTDNDHFGSRQDTIKPKLLDRDSLIVKSVIGEFPGEFGKLHHLSTETTVQDNSLIDSGKKGFFSGYLPRFLNPFSSTVNSSEGEKQISNEKEKATPLSDTPNAVTVSSIIGEFPGNFGKEVLESAECNSRVNNNVGIEQNEKSAPFISATTTNDVNNKGIKKANLTSKRKKRHHPKDYDGVHKLSNISTISEVGDIHGIPAIYGLVHRGIHPVDSSDEDFSSESQASSEDEVSSDSEFNIRNLFEMNDTEYISNNDIISSESMIAESTPTVPSISIENMNNSQNGKNNDNIVNDEMKSPLKESHSTDNVKIYDSPSLVGSLFNRQASLNEQNATSDSDFSDTKEQAARDRHNSLHIQSQAPSDDTVSDIHVNSTDDISTASNSSTLNARLTETNGTDKLLTLSSHSNDSTGSLSGVRGNTIPSRVRCAITKDHGLVRSIDPISKDASVSAQRGNGEHNAAHLNGALGKKSQFIKGDSIFENKMENTDSLDPSNSEALVLSNDEVLSNKNPSLTKIPSIKKTTESLHPKNMDSSSTSREGHLAIRKNMDNASSTQFSGEPSSKNTLNPVVDPSGKPGDVAEFDTGFVACTPSTGEKPSCNDKKSLNHKITVTNINDLPADELSIISPKSGPLFVEKRNKVVMLNNAKHEEVKEPYLNKTPQEVAMSGKSSNKSSSMESTVSNQKDCIQSTSSGINAGIGSDSAASANLQNIKPKVSSQSNSTKLLNCTEPNMSAAEDIAKQNTLVSGSEKNSKASQSQPSKNTLSKTSSALPTTPIIANKNVPKETDLAGESNKSSHERRKKISEGKQPLQQVNMNNMSEYYLVKPLPGDLDTKIPDKKPSNAELPKVLTSSWSPENAPFSGSPVNGILPSLTENSPKNQIQDENGNSSPKEKAKESLRNMKHKIKSVLKTDSNINNLSPAKNSDSIYKELPPSPKIYDSAINDVITARQEYRPSSRTSNSLSSPNLAKKANASLFINNINTKSDASGKNPYVLDSVYMHMNKVDVDHPSIDAPSTPKKINPSGIEMSTPVSSLVSSNAQKDGSEGYHYDPNVSIFTPSTEDKKSKVRRRLSLSFGKVKSSIKDIRRRDSKHSSSHGDLENSYIPNLDNNMKSNIDITPISQPNLSPRAKEKSPMISETPNTYYSVIRTKNQDHNSDTQDERFLDPQTRYQTEVDLIRKNSYDIQNGTSGKKSTRGPEYMPDSARQYNNEQFSRVNRSNAPLKIRDLNSRDGDKENIKSSAENIQPNDGTTGVSIMVSSDVVKSNRNDKNAVPNFISHSEVPVLESKAIVNNAVTSENNEYATSNSKNPVTEDQDTQQGKVLMYKEPLIDESSRHSIGVPDIQEASATQNELSNVNINDNCIQSNKIEPLAPSTDDISESLVKYPHDSFSNSKNNLDKNESVLENVTDGREGSESVARFGENNISDQHIVKVKSSGSGR